MTLRTWRLYLGHRMNRYNFTVNKLVTSFSKVNIEGASTCSLPWYYDVSSWEGLKDWLGGEHKLERPKDFLMSYNEWNPLGVDIEEDTEDN